MLFEFKLYSVVTFLCIHHTSLSTWLQENAFQTV